MKSPFIFLLSVVLLIPACASDTRSKNKKTMAGAGIGTAVGAGIGAVLGKGKGAVIGGVIGGGLGGYAGHRMDKQAAELEKVAETKRTEMGLVTKLKSDILFNTEEADLRPAAKGNIREMAAIMKKYPENVLTIKGYTDNTGTSVINEKLSQERAKAVKVQLINAGLPGEDIAIQGLGPANPVAANTSVKGRSQNRRVEIEVTVDEAKVPKENKNI